MDTKLTTERQEALIRENDQMRQAIAFSKVTIEMIEGVLLKLCDELEKLMRTMNTDGTKESE